MFVFQLLLKQQPENWFYIVTAKPRTTEYYDIDIRSYRPPLTAHSYVTSRPIVWQQSHEKNHTDTRHD